MRPAALLPLLLFAAACGRDDARAQVYALSDSAEISLITVLPGDAVYSLFGHSAIRVRDPVRDIDWSYSYGTFNFDDELFLVKFAMGRMDYYLSVANWRSVLHLYQDIEFRPTIEQILDLTKEERDVLFTFLQINAQEENRYYRYDFLFDNCSTRIREALLHAVGNTVAFPDGRDTELTFRQLLKPYLTRTPFLELGIDLLLGAAVDRKATESETAFLPDYLEASFDHASLRDSAGVSRPLVAAKDSLITISGYSRGRRAFDWPALILWSFAALTMLKTAMDARKMRTAGMVDVALFGVVGLVGSFLLFMWFGTAHHVTSQNWNLAWAWPTHLVYAGIIARHGITKVTAAYAGFSAVSAALLIAVWSMIPQDLNQTFLAVTVLIAVRGGWTYILWKRSGRTTIMSAGPPEVRS